MIRIITLLCLLALAAAPRAAMADALDYAAFSALPVQHEGRIKPIDSFARATLVQISGRESADGLDATAWLAEMLFNPAGALHRPVFRIFRPQQLDLPEKGSRYYSYADLAPVLQARTETLETLASVPEKDWNEDQRELVRLSETSLLYAQLLRSFSFLLPLNLELPAPLAKEWKMEADKPHTLQDFRPYRAALEKRVQTIIARRGKDPARYPDADRKIAQFAMDLHILETAGRDNFLLRILPGMDGEEWHSPWALTEQGQGSPQSAAYLDLWRKMAAAYQSQDKAAWDAAMAGALQESRTFDGQNHTGLEIAYNTLQPLMICALLYFAAFAGMAVYSLRGNRWAHLAGFVALTLGACVQTAAIVSRIMILGRAPVGTLYESILFVALICVIAAIVIEYLRQDGNGLLIGSVAGLLLLFTAGSFADGDTMKMLVAVLNTNFWLSTHVLCITAGYGFCLIASLLAHVWLAREASGNKADDLVAPVRITALIALLLTTVGTILGGIWADQSWGRFWGWDPKENGALLIVLWLAWVFHGQIGGKLNRAAFMAVMAVLSCIVAVAWFGVNLLSVGLHSYGFITGIAGGLGAFCALECAVTGWLWHKTHRRKQAAAI